MDIELEVVGRHALLFDDDAMAAFVNSNDALVEWNSIPIDRYDVRHLLSSPPPSRRRRNPQQHADYPDSIETDLDYERYLDLSYDQQGKRKRLNLFSYISLWHVNWLLFIVFGLFRLIRLLRFIWSIRLRSNSHMVSLISLNYIERNSPHVVGMFVWDDSYFESSRKSCRFKD